jgi:hypothetical protein
VLPVVAAAVLLAVLAGVDVLGALVEGAGVLPAGCRQSSLQHNAAHMARKCQLRAYGQHQKCASASQRTFGFDMQTKNAPSATLSACIVSSSFSTFPANTSFMTAKSLTASIFPRRVAICTINIHHLLS